jgi:hypothetical protein
MVTVPARKYVQAAAIVRAGRRRDAQAGPGRPQRGEPGQPDRVCPAHLPQGPASPGTRRRPHARPHPVRPPARQGPPRVKPRGRGPLPFRALAAARRASGLTQPALAALTGYSVTTIGHAETGRLWQSPQFWEDRPCPRRRR